MLGGRHIFHKNKLVHGLMDKQLAEVETLCLDAIRKDDPKTAEVYFGPYLSYVPTTQHTPLIRAYMLLHRCALDQRRSFYTLLETVSPAELDDRNIRLVMEVERCVNTGAVERLRKIIDENTQKELHALLQSILERQRRSIELTAGESRESGTDSGARDRKNIADAMFIGKSIANF